MGGRGKQVSDPAMSEAARRGLGKAEAGDATSTHRLKDLRKNDPAGEEAVEQEASEGPEGRGLSR